MFFRKISLFPKLFSAPYRPFSSHNKIIIIQIVKSFIIHYFFSGKVLIMLFKFCRMIAFASLGALATMLIRSAGVGWM